MEQSTRSEAVSVTDQEIAEMLAGVRNLVRHRDASCSDVLCNLNDAMSCDDADMFAEDVQKDALLAAYVDAYRTIATLRKALERYGWHLPDCATRFCVCEIGGGYHSSIPPLPDHAYEGGKCTCGLSAALDEKEG